MTYTAKNSFENQYYYEDNSAEYQIAKKHLALMTRYYWSGDKIIAIKDENDLIQFVYDEKDNLFSMKLNGETTIICSMARMM